MSVDAFPSRTIHVEAGRVFVRRAGSGPAVLLLHGYPETSLAWRKIAPALANQFTIVAADLPGYGDSIVSDALFDAGRFSKRAMARVLVDAMSALGLERFAVVGHDRGARVAYRMALDHPDRIRALAVLDVISILDMAERLTYEAARHMGHWLWLAQPSTVPETLVGLDPERYVHHILEQWGGSCMFEEPEIVDEYVRCMSNPSVLKTMGAEYRADLLDLEHDTTDRMASHRITCPLLAVWARGGLVEQFGDPVALWQRWADDVDGRALAAGHFLMEESPRELTDLLRPFLENAFQLRASTDARSASAD